MKSFLFILVFGFCLQGQHLWQKPKAPLQEDYLRQLIGPITESSPSRALNILWLYGYDKYHIPGAHDYVKVKDLMTKLLRTVKNVSVDEALQFPSDTQLEEADLIVMYLHFESQPSHKNN